MTFLYSCCCINRVMQKLILPKPEEIKTVHVYPNLLLWKLSPKLGWSNFPLLEPSIVNRTYANSATDFFVQTYVVHRRAQTLAEEIYIHMQKPEVKQQSFPDAKLHDMCLAPFGGEYYRGEIIEMLTAKRVKVFFSDYGNTDDVFLASLKYLPAAFEQPRLIMNCRWDMALTDEFSETKAEQIILDDVAPLVATHKLADGQYIVKLEQYTPYTKFTIHPYPKEVEGYKVTPRVSPNGAN